jgi:hypothetical protein
MRTHKGSLLTTLLCATLAVALACGDDDAPTGTTDLEVAGTWSITEVVSTSGACSSGTDTYTATVTQSGTSITVNIGGLTYGGTLSGNSLSWSGSYPEDGGTTTTSISLTFASNSSLSGSSSWSWTDGMESCTGTSTISGSKVT